METQQRGVAWWALVIVVVLALLALRVAQRWSTLRRAEVQRARVATQAAWLEATATALALEATAIHDPAFIEQHARSEGKLAEQGEYLVQPVPVPGASPPAEWAEMEATPTPTPTPAPWEVWWALFFAKP